jgi:hypothetical protein
MALQHAVPAGQPHAAGQDAGERPERLDVLAADEQHADAARARDPWRRRRVGGDPVTEVVRMAESQPKAGWLARWREKRRAKRERASERAHTEFREGVPRQGSGAPRHEGGAGITGGGGA